MLHLVTVTQDNLVTRTTALWKIKWQLTQIPDTVWSVRSDIVDNGDKCCLTIIVIKSITWLALHLRTELKLWPRTYIIEVRSVSCNTFPTTCSKLFYWPLQNCMKNWLWDAWRRNAGWTRKDSFPFPKIGFSMDPANQRIQQKLPSWAYKLVSLINSDRLMGFGLFLKQKTKLQQWFHNAHATTNV